MKAPQRIRKKGLVPAILPRQIGIAFESKGLQGLSSAQRMKAIVQLSQLLMLAAGVAAAERDHER